MNFQNDVKNSYHRLWQHKEPKEKEYVTYVSTKNAISSNLVSVDLENAVLSGVDQLKGPSINLEACSVEELTKKLNDVLMCHNHLKRTGLISHDKKPIFCLDICYE